MSASVTAAASNDGEFTIRVTGAAPPPLPSAAKNKKGKQGGGRGKAAKNNAAQQKQQQRRYNLRLRPSSSLDQLQKDVFALFNVPSGSTKAYELSFLGGFPPKALNPEGKQTVHELGIRPNESLIAKFSLSCDTKGDKTAENGDTKQVAAVKSNSQEEPATGSDAVSNTGRPKRASAMAATANFADVIAAQDAILKKDKKSPKKKGSFAVGNTGGFGNANKRIVTSAPVANKRPKTVKMEGDGYRLSDGKSVAGSSPSKKKSAGKKNQKPMFKSEDDVSNKLLSSLGGSGKSGKVGKYLRSAMKGVVTKSYEASRAAVRVTAANTGDYSFEKVKGGSVVDGGGVVLGTAKDHEPQNKSDEAVHADGILGIYTVAYSKGMEGRGRYEEQVEIIGLAVLKGALESVYDTKSSNDSDEHDGEDNKDGRLRPVLIAELSPRVFWSLVYNCSEAAKKDQSTTRLSVDDMLRSILPQLDWSHLGRSGRKRNLSEKARDNLRQKSEVATQPTSKSSSKYIEDERRKAIEEVEELGMNAAMLNEGDDVGSNERERRFRAAEARSENVNDMKTLSTSSPTSQKNDMALDDWTLVTPIEDDIDELIQCIMEGASSEEESSTGKNYDEEAAKAWAGILLGSVRNWRELANSNPEYILSKLTDKSPLLPSSDTIKLWIAAAQAESIDEIMFEILGDRDAFELLSDKAKSSQPRDLINWKHAPGMLLDLISCTEKSSKKWEKSDVMRWSSRARTALDVCTWLDDNTAPLAT